MPDGWWWFFAPGGALVLTGAVIFWWLARLQDRVSNHAERIARLEGRSDVDPDR